jgi:hypothetical protein
MSRPAGGSAGQGQPTVASRSDHDKSKLSWPIFVTIHSDAISRSPARGQHAANRGPSGERVYGGLDGLSLTGSRSCEHHTGGCPRAGGFTSVTASNVVPRVSARRPAGTAESISRRGVPTGASGVCEG